MQMSLQMTLFGISAMAIEQNSTSNTFELKLNKPEETGRLHIRVTEKQNVSEFEFHLSGALRDSRSREVCFHYAYQPASRSGANNS